NDLKQVGHGEPAQADLQHHGPATRLASPGVVHEIGKGAASFAGREIIGAAGQHRPPLPHEPRKRRLSELQRDRGISPGHGMFFAGPGGTWAARYPAAQRALPAPVEYADARDDSPDRSAGPLGGVRREAGFARTLADLSANRSCRSA